MKLPIRVLSDLHLGHEVSRVSRVEQLRSLLHGAGTVVLNGDTWEELAPSCRERSRVMLHDLQALGEELGVEVVYLRGNHDPSWVEAAMVQVAEGRIAVMHGDGLCWDSSPWKPEVLRSQELVRNLWDDRPDAWTDVQARLDLARDLAVLVPSLRHKTGRRLWQRVWDAVMPPSRAWKMLQAWWSQGRLGADFCERYLPDVQVLVIGHFHHHGWWRQRGRLVINTGSFVIPSQAYWVQWDGSVLAYGPVVERHDGFAMGRVEREWELS